MIWDFWESVATANAGPWQVQVAPNQPRQCGTIGNSDHPEMNWEVFGISPSASHSMVPSQIYARGTELIATFDQSKEDLFAFHIYWRAIQSEHADFAVEMWLSVDTQLLESTPSFTVQCNAEPGSWRKVDLNANSVCLVSEAEKSTGVWLIQADDLMSAELPIGSELALVEFFGGFMEKGVIRRARTRFLVFPDQVTEETLKMAAVEFEQQQLPLTA